MVISGNNLVINGTTVEAADLTNVASITSDVQTQLNSKANTSGSVLQVASHIQKNQFTIATTAETEIMSVSFVAKSSNPKVLIKVELFYGFADNPNNHEMRFSLKKDSTYLNVATGQYNTSNTFFNVDADYQYNSTNSSSSVHQFGRAYTTAFETFTGISSGSTITLKVFASSSGTNYINRVGASSSAAGAVSSLTIMEIGA